MICILHFVCHLHSRDSVETAVIHVAFWELMFKNSVQTEKTDKLNHSTNSSPCMTPCMLNANESASQGQGWHDWEIYHGLNHADTHISSRAVSVSFASLLSFFFFFFLRFASVLVGFLALWCMRWFKPVQHC